MKTIIVKPVRIVILVLSVSLFSSVVLGSAAPPDDSARSSTEKSQPTRGTGKWSESSILRTEEPLDPPCVSLVTRTGDITFTGIIQTVTDGHLEIFVLINRCTDTTLGPATGVLTLNNVTIAGREGGIVMKFQAQINGETTSEQGTVTSMHLKILSGSGDLEGIQGDGLATGRATVTGHSPAYWIEIQFDDDEKH